jgi:hypothetical protein
MRDVPRDSSVFSGWGVDWALDDKTGGLVHLDLGPYHITCVSGFTKEKLFKVIAHCLAI